MHILDFKKANLSMRIPTNLEWDLLMDVTNEDDMLSHWKGMFTWVEDEENRYRLPTFRRAVRGYGSARFWSYRNATYQNVTVGFRPAVDLEHGALPPDFKNGETVVVGTLYMDDIPVRVPQKPTYNGDIADYIPGAKLEIRPALDDPDYQVTGILVDGSFIADRCLLKEISYMNIETAILLPEKEPPHAGDLEYVAFPVTITIRKHDGESDEDARKRLEGLLSSELGNLADHDISCAVGSTILRRCN